jgi:GxxExxY protein
LIQEPSIKTDTLVRSIIGVAIEVHRILGPGYLESVYEEALAFEFAKRRIPFERQKIISVAYKGITVGESRLDFLIDGRVIVELKSVDSLAPIHTAQVLSYLKATSYEVGLLVNFNVMVLKNGVKRLVRTTQN